MSNQWFESNISIPFPLSTGAFARLYVPPKMSISDAKRLKRMINALYINKQARRSEQRQTLQAIRSERNL